MKGSINSFAKKASNLYQSIHQQVNMCSIAAVVAVVSVLALTQPSEAKIVYTPANVVLSCQQYLIIYQKQYNLDLNHDGVTDFTITVEATSAQVCEASRGVTESPASGNGAIFSGGYATALSQGAPIGHSQQFQGSGGERDMAFADFFNCREIDHGGPWYDVTDRYLGLRFQRNGRTHYGWARLTVGAANYAALTGYAYETIAGKSIKAGQKKEAADDRGEEDFGADASLTSPIPDKQQLGALALGAPGLLIWRRKESLAVTQ